MALVTDWFSRSGNLPLSFTLKGQENVLPILAFLLQYCTRWQYINFSIPLETLRCLEAAKGHLQRLETMQINAVDGNSPSWVEQIFKSAPRLRNVSLSCRFLWNGSNGSWAHLTELDAGHESYTVGDCLTLLQTARNLQELRIAIDGDVVEGHPRLVFSHPLVCLHVHGTRRVPWMFFNCITLPNIRDLSVGEICYDSPLLQFISFLTRSSPLLRHFSFKVPAEVAGVWDDMVVQILQHTPSLHSLCLAYTWPYSRCGGGSIFKRLSILDNGEVDCLIPKLDTISITVSNGFVIPEYLALKEMILSRRSTGHTTDPFGHICEQIQKVVVECYDGDTDWQDEVFEILAPRQIVDTLQIVAY